ncbi:DUF2934 domain-containing protein (plasmid) [Tistrella mobilis]|uniref:DUF2934 domain-containing protein n=1 Tax=Tistrella mobilis TaxID=171437 RepID=A0A162LLX7_9PROT|nr:DUF2934 domain-containing protein [Tistrella mobilis]KYO55591.1 hypothetical protein AUP44_23240 [Tistrella mobilis]
MHTSDDTPTDRTRRLEKIAHRIWVEEGRPHGRDRAHWAAAEAELEALEAANRSVPETGRAAGPEDGPYEAGPTPPVPGPPVPGSPAPSAAEPGPAAPETRTRQRLAAETKASAGATRAPGAGTRRAKGGTDAAPTATADAPKKAGTKPATRSRTRRPAGDA